MFLTIILLSVYILLLLGIALFDNKSETEEGFIIGDRKVGVMGFLASTAASVRDGGGLLSTVAVGFLMGYGFYNFYFGVCLGLLLLLFFAPKARNVAKAKGYVTIPEMVRDFVGPKTEKTSAIVMIVCVFLIIALQFFVLGTFLQTVFGLSDVLSIFIVCSVVAAQLLLGGYKTIVKTDILQFFIMLLPIALLFFTPIKMENITNFASLYQGQSTSHFLLMLLFGIILIFCAGDFWQRIFSAKSEAVAKKGILTSIASYLIITIPMTLLGISAIGIIPADSNSNNALFNIISNPAYPAFIVGFLSLILVSATMSTIDTFSYVVSSTVIKDFSKKKLNKKEYVKKSRYILLLLLILSAVLSFFIEDVLTYVFAINGMCTILAPLFFMVGCGFIKKTGALLDWMFSCALLITLILGVYWMINGFLFTSTTTSLILPAITTTLMMFGLILFKLKKIKV